MGHAKGQDRAQDRPVVPRECQVGPFNTTNGYLLFSALFDIEFIIEIMPCGLFFYFAENMRNFLMMKSCKYSFQFLFFKTCGIYYIYIIYFNQLFL